MVQKAGGANYAPKTNLELENELIDLTRLVGVAMSNNKRLADVVRNHAQALENQSVAIRSMLDIMKRIEKRNKRAGGEFLDEQEQPERTD